MTDNVDNVGHVNVIVSPLLFNQDDDQFTTLYCKPSTMSDEPKLTFCESLPMLRVHPSREIDSEDLLKNSTHSGAEAGEISFITISAFTIDVETNNKSKENKIEISILFTSIKLH